MKVKSESEVAQSCPTLIDQWTAAYQAPRSMGFARQNYWSGVPLPSPNDQLIRINITRGWDLIILTKTYTYRMLVERRPIGMAPSTSEPKKNSFVLSQLGGTINYKR